MNHARQTLTACAQRWCLVSVRFITTDCHDRTLTSHQRTEKVYKLYINKIRNKTDVELAMLIHKNNNVILFNVK